MLVAVSLGVAYRADIGDSNGEVLWSPYNHLRVRTGGDNIDDGFTIDVNNQFLLSGFDLSPDAVHPPGLPLEDGPKITSLVDYFNFPFELTQPDSVLILGAGVGNDIAAAQRAGVSQITAVEIDCRVAEYGADHHPEQPHAGAELVIDDARSYLRSSNDKFDLVLSTNLDAHGLLASSSSVQLDSFVEPWCSWRWLCT